MTMPLSPAITAEADRIRSEASVAHMRLSEKIMKKTKEQLAGLPSASDLDAVAAEDQVKLATAPTPAHPPTAEEIDAACIAFENAEACFETAKKTMDAEEERLVAMVRAHGFRPEGAPQSQRLVGRRNTATVTIGRSITLFQGAILTFHQWCKRTARMPLFWRLFDVEQKYVAVEGWRDVLKSFNLSPKIHDRVGSMVALCTDVKPKAPSLKVEVIEPEKPARKPRAGKKAA